MCVLKIKQQSEKETSHNKNGTPCGELTIPYSDFICNVRLADFVLFL